MTGLLGRIGASFLAPAEATRTVPPPPDPPPAPPPPAPVPAVLCRPGDAWLAGGAVALAALGDAEASVAVVAGWAVALPSLLAPAVPAARRLAARLAERGHEAKATGRLVLVAAAEAGEMGRVGAAAGDVPVVGVYAGARDDAVDAALHDADRVVVAAGGPDDAVAALAAATLVRPATVTYVNGPPAARVLAATGVALVAPLRDQVRPTVPR